MIDEFWIVGLDDIVDARVVFPAGRNLQVNVVIQRSLWKCLGVVDLSTGKAKYGGKDHNESNGRPVHDGRVHIPIFNPIAHHATIDADATLVPKERSVNGTFAAIRPYGVENVMVCR